jgi:spoIIIJ-associated protein
MSERHHQSVTVSAKTVDDAVAEAERELGVSRDFLDITVITEGTKGFLGMRAENARILAVVVAGAPAPDAPPAAPAARAPSRPARRRTEEPVAVVDEIAVAELLDVEMDQEADEEPARAEERKETAGIAREVLETLLRYMQVEARVTVRSATNPIVLDVETASGGLLIGRRGDTLSALQYMVNVLVGKRTRGWTKVVVDVERWRERREETLRALAFRQADRVRQQRRSIALDPMPANERRIIHLALQEQRDVETHSEGEEPNRRLVISLRR